MTIPRRLPCEAENRRLSDDLRDVRLQLEAVLEENDRLRKALPAYADAIRRLRDALGVCGYEFGEMADIAAKEPRHNTLRARAVGGEEHVRRALEGE